VPSGAPHRDVEPPSTSSRVARQPATGGRIGHQLIVVGGTDDQAALERVGNRCLAIDLRTGAATRLADYPEAGLTTGTAAAVGKTLYVFGGARWMSCAS
jgi:hypothetical protein